MNLEPSLDAEALVAAIRGPSPHYKREAVDAIVLQRELTTPHLLHLLEEMADDPAGFVARIGEDDFDPLYTLVLLAHLRETRAHAPLLKIARLPKALLDDVLGGFVIEGLSALLLSTCGGEVGGIRALLVDRTVADACRTQAAEALVMAAHLGYTRREEVLELLASLLTEVEAGSDEAHPWTLWVCAMLKLRPLEHKQAIRRAWDEGLLEDFILGGWDDIEGDLEGDAEETGDQLAEECEQALPSDVHDWMGWWDCFRTPVERGRRVEVAVQAFAELFPQMVDARPVAQPPQGKKLARNGPCWCGSGRKYKGCHFKSDEAAS
jgi:hypothetical protein